MKKKAGISRWLSNQGVPADALGDCARITMTGRASVSVEGQHGVIELSKKSICMKTGNGVLMICGNELSLCLLSETHAVIKGETIDCVAYR